MLLNIYILTVCQFYFQKYSVYHSVDIIKYPMEQVLKGLPVTFFLQNVSFIPIFRMHIEGTSK